MARLLQLDWVRRSDRSQCTNAQTLLARTPSFMSHLCSSQGERERINGVLSHLWWRNLVCIQRREDRPATKAWLGRFRSLSVLPRRCFAFKASIKTNTLAKRNISAVSLKPEPQRPWEHPFQHNIANQFLMKSCFPLNRFHFPLPEGSAVPFNSEACQTPFGKGKTLGSSVT